MSASDPIMKAQIGLMQTVLSCSLATRMDEGYQRLVPAANHEFS